MAEQDADNPRTTSSVYDASIAFWRMVGAILCGVEALRESGLEKTSYIPGPAQPVAQLNELQRSYQTLRTFESVYLPRFPNESLLNYDRRRRTAFLTNVFSDILNNLASKPFAKTCELDETSGDDLKKLAENIDGLGNNLHVYAYALFKDALARGISWTLVDFTNVPASVQTLGAERDIGARPYFVHVPAEKLNGVYSDFVNGKEIIFHACIDEPCIELEGYQEVHRNRVRELNREAIRDGKGNVIAYGPPTWTIWEEVEGKDAKGNDTTAWIVKDTGPIKVGFIPLVPFIIGNRVGTSWKVEPWSRDLAYMQIKLFQQESNLDYIKELTAFPILTGNGVDQDMYKSDGKVVVPVGPSAVLFTGMTGDGKFGNWGFIEPTAASLTFLQTENKNLGVEMRDLGMQPLATQNITIVTSKNVSMKANSQVQAWALRLQDSLEQAWKFVCLWLGQTNIEPEVNVHLDFGVDLDAGPELDALAKAQAANVISKRLHFNELKRRGVLADDADWEDDQQDMAEQQQGLQPEQQIDPRTGKPLTIDPLTGKPVVTKPTLAAENSLAIDPLTGKPLLKPQPVAASN